MPARAQALRLKRVYEAADADDGYRVLVDRLWPRGLSREAAKVDLWAKALAPSDALRRAVHADPDYPEDAVAWKRFMQSFRIEFDAAAATPDGAAAIDAIRTARRKGAVTLLFGAQNVERNNAAALKSFLDS